jgi:hypothetical protein
MVEKLALNDISIVPCDTTDIRSRSECNPYLKRCQTKDCSLYGSLPLFTAPMSTVVDENNIELFTKNKIIPILPRNICLDKRLEYLKRGYWIAFGLSEIEQLKDKNLYDIRYPVKILIDVANGHMKCIYDIAKELKKHNRMNKIMIGNIANPDTYLRCCENAIDYVRIGIGGGQGCLTASNVGVFYPTASLITEISELRSAYKNTNMMPTETKVIADGCAKGYSDIIKALALGADYVMCGKLFAKMLETPGECTQIQTDVLKFLDNGCRSHIIDQYTFDFKSIKHGEKITKEYYGMSTKRAQKEFCAERIKTAEGKVEKIKIEYTMSQWVENFTDYLRSAMAYTGKRNIEDFIGDVETIRLSENASNSYNK